MLDKAEQRRRLFSAAVAPHSSSGGAMSKAWLQQQQKQTLDGCATDAMAEEEDEQQDEQSALLIASVEVLLRALGEDLFRDGLLKTPARVARAFACATAGYRTQVDRILQEALFSETGPDNGSAGMVVVRSVDLFATCESCLLPFRVRCHMAYIPSKQRVVGLSKLPRVADVYASRLQNPQKLVSDIAAGLWRGFHPSGVAVVAECWHLQWPEGRGHSWSCEPVSWVLRTVCAGEGEFQDRGSSLWDEFFSILELSGIDLKLEQQQQQAQEQQQQQQSSLPCPLAAGLDSSRISSLKLSNGLKPLGGLEEMLQAVRSMLRVLGEDPDREELRNTPLCYSRWLLASTQGSRCDERSITASHNSTPELAASNGGEPKSECGEMKAVLNLPFCSQCEHHLLPFSGIAHIGYLVRGSSRKLELDRESLQRIVKLYSCRLQVQERLTKQVAEAVMRSSAAAISGVMVVLEASHVCMLSRGIKKAGSNTATMATLGEFAQDVKARSRFLRVISAARRTSLS